MLDGREPLDNRSFIHLRLEPKAGMEINDFIGKLPDHFIKPKPDTLGRIEGIDVSILRNGDWAYAWKVLGEGSEWILSLVESHEGRHLTLQQITQFLHYFTNPLMLGNTCLFIPGGFLTF
jgi:hypothetical protein